MPEEMNDNIVDRKKKGQLWRDRIMAREKKEGYWLKDAADATKMYANEGSAMGSSNAPTTKTRYNILHSNVETIVPAIYNSTPSPDIRPRWGAKTQENEVAKDTAQILERSIEVQVDDNNLDEAVEMVAQDAYVAGRGVLRVRFDAEIEQEISYDPDLQEEFVEKEKVVNERLEFENVAWPDFRMGQAQRWADVPWVAFRHYFDKDAMADLTDTDLRDLEQASGGFKAFMTEEERKQCEDQICVWEIWNKSTKTVKFLREADGMIIQEQDDPYQLTDFFPMASPMTPIRTSGSMMPVCPYAIYQDLAEDLDRISKRIKNITTGLKVRGLFVGGADIASRLAEAEDNEIIPATDLEGMAQTGGLARAIEWWPIESAIAVLAQLYQNRELTRQAIYEITGIADIVRGQSSPIETLGAQQIKTQWGTLRLQKMQRMVQRLVRDTFSICAELIANHFTDETITLMTGLEVSPEVRTMLDKPVLRHYRVDVESDSTIRADLTKAKGEMAEFLNGTAQFFGTMAPLISEDPEAALPVAEIYNSFARHFKLGKQAEDALQELIEAARQRGTEKAETEDDPTPEQQEAIMQMQLKTQELQLKVAQAQTSAQLELAKLELEAQKAFVEAQKAEFEARAKAEELGIKREEVQIKDVEVQRKIVKDAEEIELERQQQRPVAIG